MRSHSLRPTPAPWKLPDLPKPLQSVVNKSLCKQMAGESPRLMSVAWKLVLFPWGWSISCLGVVLSWR